MVNLGDEVKDKITGLQGIAICRSDWLYGCVRIGVQPKEVKDGKPVETTYIDEDQLEVVMSREDTGFGYIGKIKRVVTGGDRFVPTRAKDDRR